MGASEDTTDPFATAVPAARAELRASDVPVFPVAAWERYQPLRFLGQGGMGRVFLARDPRLQREVAIKLVRDDDPELSRRLVGEARAQARVQHDRVCKVYEVGEVSGHVYIAMQYVAGKPLGALASELNMAEKVLIVREAALGVHEAHRSGIIHRDLKPANILVEKDDDGALRPYVMDFGLARSLPEGASVTVAAVGTPHYMSPEQALGDTRALDRRTDVYGLGATLYHLLCGAPPIEGENTLDILSKIPTVEPKAPRALEPAIPTDLEAIVLRCLEKDRTARYDSARALAEDLDRFLNGEPVQARPTGLVYRLRKRLARHRRLAILLAAALMTVLVAMGFAVKARLDAAEREKRARIFTEVVERIEAMALYSALAPLHDIRPDRLALRADLDSLDNAIQAAGPLSAASGHYALGRGALALGEPEKARSELELAWNQGYREPRVAYALALVLGDLYQTARLEAERIQDAPLREAKKKDIAGKYRDPALAYLKQAEGAKVPSPHYMAARLASYEDRLDDALSELNAMGDTLPWFYEAPALRGSILATRAARRGNKGDSSGAVADFDAGRTAYQHAIAIGESDPTLYEAAADLEYAALIQEIYGEGKVEPSFERGTRDVSHALSIDPERYQALLLNAQFHRRLAEHQGNQGKATDDLLQKAMVSAEAAIALQPDRKDARVELGRIYWQKGQSRSERGQDPGEALQKALTVYEGIAAPGRDYDFQINLGLVFDSWADYEMQTGGDPEAHRGKAIEAYRTATELDEGPAFAWLNLGNAYLLRASYPRAKDPDGDLALAIAALDKAGAKNPGQVVGFIYSGDAHSLAAERIRARGGDPRPELARALALYRQGLVINPNLAYLHNGVGAVLLQEALEAWDHGESPEPRLRDAQRAFEEAMRVAPDQGFGLINVGEVLATLAQRKLDAGDDPAAAAAAALPVIQRSIAALPDMAPAHLNLGKVYTVLASYDLEKGRSPDANVDLAEKALTEALTRDPDAVLAHRLLAEARALRGRYRAEHRQDVSDDLAAATQAYEKALALAPDDSDVLVSFGHFCRLRAHIEQKGGGASRPWLERGLTLVERMLSRRPRSPDGLMLRGSLRLAQTRGANGEEGSKAAAEALSDLNAALAANPNLRARWSQVAAAAQNLTRP